MFPRLPVWSAFLLAWCECLAAAGPPEAKPTVLRDRYGDPLPPKAIARLGTTRFRTIGGQGEIALSPDGKLLALGGVRALRLVRSTTGEKVRSIKLEMGVVGSIRFSRDGGRFAVVSEAISFLYPLSVGGRPSDKSLIVGEVVSGKILLQSEMACFHVEFSPDSRRLFALQHKPDTQEGPVICWDVDSGKEVWRTSALGCFALSPDGKMVAGGEQNGCVRLWDASSGRDHGRLKGHHSAILALAFSPDGRTLVSTSGDPQFRGGENPPERSVRSWDVATGKQRFHCKDAGLATDVRFAPDGRTFATMTHERRTFHLWDAASGELLQYFPGEGEPDRESPLYAFAFSPDGKMLFYCCQQDRIATIYQWDIFAGKEVRHWHTEKSLRLVRALAVSPEARHCSSRATVSAFGISPAARRCTRCRRTTLPFSLWHFLPTGGVSLPKIIGWSAAYGKRSAASRLLVLPRFCSCMPLAAIVDFFSP